MALDQDTIALLIATLSVVGLTVVVAIPTVSSTYFALLSKREDDDSSLMEIEPGYRLLKLLAQPDWVMFFYSLSILFVVPGLLMVLDAISGAQMVGPVNFQLDSLILLTIGMGLFVGGVVFAFLRSTILLPFEVKLTIAYMQAVRNRIKVTPRQRQFKKCPNCGTPNGKLSQYCRLCGAKLP